MKINTKLTLAFLLMSLLSLAVAGALSYFYVEKTLTEQVLNQLQAVASIQRSRTEAIIEQNFDRLASVSSRTQLRLSLQSFIDKPEVEHQDKLNRILRDALSSVDDFKALTILTLDGEVVASTDATRIGQDLSAEEFFIRGQRENVIDIFFLDEDQNLGVYLTGPLYLENNLLGVVVIESTADSIIALITGYAGLEKTGETLLAKRNENGDAVYLTPLRFDRQAPLRRIMPKDDLSAPITQALLKNQQLFTNAVDYRGEPVLAATQYIAPIDWGLVTKIDKTEAFAPIVQLRKLFATIILVTAIVVTLVSIYVAQTITRPIVDLTQIARKISQGDLSPRAKITSGDEIGILGQAFNQMAENIIQINLTLEQKIKELKTDIIKRKKVEVALRESEQKIRSIIEQTHDGILLVDGEGKIIEWNPGREQIMGLKRAEVLGRPFWDVQYQLTPDEAKASTTYQQVKTRITDFLKTGKAPWLYQLLEREIENPDGTRRIIQSLAFPIQTSKGLMLSSIARDITEQKRAEEQLRRYAAELQKINRELKTFAYILSHDMRAPLVSIKGFSQELCLALEEMKAILYHCLPCLTEKEQAKLTVIFEEDVPEDLNFINSSVSRLNDMINAILKLSRLGRCEFNLEPIDMNTLVQSILNSLAHQLEQRKVSVEVQSLPEIEADRMSMEQIMGNILDNAIKYLNPKRPGKIAITAEQHSEEITFHICDNGCGIWPKDLPKIFDIFQRAGRPDVPGEGMGLAYVQTLIRRYGGRIWCESEAGVGTIFSFTIPRVLKDNYEEQGENYAQF